MKPCVLVMALGVFLAASAGQAEVLPSKRMVIPFEGVLDFKARTLSMAIGSVPSGALEFKVTVSVPGRYDLHADIRHVATPAGDLAAELDGKVEVTGTQHARRELVGEIKTRYTLVDYRPVRDLHLEFTVRQRRLSIDQFWFGVVSGRGTVNLTGAHEVEAGVDLLSTDIEDVWSIMRARGLRPPALSGIVAGTLLFKGPVSGMFWSGQLSAYNGRLQDMDYERIDLRFDGQYPLMRLNEGTVTPVQGPQFKVQGSLDLSNMARMSTQLYHLKHDLVVAEDDRGRSWTFNRLIDRPGQETQLISFISGQGVVRNEDGTAIGLKKHIGF